MLGQLRRRHASSESCWCNGSYSHHNKCASSWRGRYGACSPRLSSLNHRLQAVGGDPTPCFLEPLLPADLDLLEELEAHFVNALGVRLDIKMCGNDARVLDRLAGVEKRDDGPFLEELVHCTTTEYKTGRRGRLLLRRIVNVKVARRVVGLFFAVIVAFLFLIIFNRRAGAEQLAHRGVNLIFHAKGLDVVELGHANKDRYQPDLHDDIGTVHHSATDTAHETARGTEASEATKAGAHGRGLFGDLAAKDLRILVICGTEVTYHDSMFRNDILMIYFVRYNFVMIHSKDATRQRFSHTPVQKKVTTPANPGRRPLSPA